MYIDTIEEVIQGNFCVGCGVCANVDQNIKMVHSKYGTIIPTSVGANKSTTAKVCPFTSKVLEDEIANNHLVKSVEFGYLKGIGLYDKCLVGYTIEGEYRKNGSSGGLVSWIGNELLDNNEIDALIHVKQSTNKNSLFEYDISYSTESVKEGGSSRYYPISLTDVLELVENSQDVRFGIVAVPCFIKSIRLLMDEKPIFKERIKYCIGIVCGHLKSKAFSELLAWQQGCLPSDIKTVNFRTKLKYRSASSYGFSSESNSGKKVVTPMADLFGGDWGLGLFKLKACDYCDDVFAETADVVIGDAWLPGYRKDSKGTNVIVSRNQVISKLLEEGKHEGRIFADDVPVELALKSQAAGIRHRTEGMSFRIQEARNLGKKTPKKRFEPADFDIDPGRQEIYRLRSLIAQISHEYFLLAKINNDINVFMKLIKPLSSVYENVTKKSKLSIIKAVLFRRVNSGIRKISLTYNKEVYKK